MTLIFPLKSRITQSDVGFDINSNTDHEVLYSSKQEKLPEQVENVLKEIQMTIQQPLESWTINTYVGTFGRISETVLDKTPENVFRCICSFGENEIYHFSNYNLRRVYIPANSCCVVYPSISSKNTIKVSSKPHRNIQGKIEKRSNTYMRLICVFDIEVPIPVENADEAKQEIETNIEVEKEFNFKDLSKEEKIKYVREMSSAAIDTVEDKETIKDLIRITKHMLKTL